jgi:hypothetical protein
MRRMWDEIHTLHYDLFDEAAAADPEAAASRQGQPAAAGAAAEAAAPVRQVGRRLEISVKDALDIMLCASANIMLKGSRWSYKLAACSCV